VGDQVLKAVAPMKRHSPVSRSESASSLRNPQLYKSIDLLEEGPDMYEWQQSTSFSLKELVALYMGNHEFG
jgi:hypothetical protein